MDGYTRKPRMIYFYKDLSSVLCVSVFIYQRWTNRKLYFKYLNKINIISVLLGIKFYGRNLMFKEAARIACYWYPSLCISFIGLQSITFYEGFRKLLFISSPSMNYFVLVFNSTLTLYITFCVLKIKIFQQLDRMYSIFVYI